MVKMKPIISVGPTRKLMDNTPVATTSRQPFPYETMLLAEKETFRNCDVSQFFEQQVLTTSRDNQEIQERW